MRDLLVSIFPDPGAVIFLAIAAIVFTGLFCMVTDKRKVAPTDRSDVPLSPEDDARRRPF